MEPDENRNPFSEAVAERLREIKGPRSNEFLASKTGVNGQTISRYLNGQTPSSWEFLARLAASEGIDLNAFLGVRAVVEV